MKTLIASARNIRHIWSPSSDELKAEIEAVLTVIRKHTEFVGAGLTQVERCETIRFDMSPAGARSLAERLVEWADEAESQSERLTIGPNEETSPSA